MIRVRIVGDNVPSFTAEFGGEGSNPDWGMSNLTSLFGEGLDFGGNNTFRNQVGWVEVDGNDLAFLAHTMVGVLRPSGVGDGFLGHKMRWYGDTARTILWAWVEGVLIPDAIKHSDGIS